MIEALGLGQDGLRLRKQAVDETEQEDFKSFLKEGAEKIKFNSLKRLRRLEHRPP